MYKAKIEADLKIAIEKLGFKVSDIDLSIPENDKFGDYSTNISLQLAKQDSQKRYQSPQELASKILEKLGHPNYLERVEIAGPGFVNFYLTNQALLKLITERENGEKSKLKLKNYLIEYGDPNTHKAFHIGHLRTLIIGESISRLLEYQGNNVFRVNYGSDIGPTVAKALWGVQHYQDEFKKTKESGSLKEKAEYLGRVYAYAHSKYESNDKVKQEIDSLTAKLYQRDPSLLELWEETKQWSLAYFESIFSRMGVEFDLRVNESEIDKEGKDIVLENVGKIFVKDDGAIIFPGEKYGLHNRVFITSAGNPIYEAKEVGLIKKYEEIFPFDEAIIFSDVQQASFFEVVNKAIELLYPHLKGKKKHFSYGFLSLSTGKMSSRAGNIVTADELIDTVIQEIISNFELSKTPESLKVAEKIALGAIKFGYIKYSINSDMVLDIEKSISLSGDSGPYVMYVFARIQSLINRANNSESKTKSGQAEKEKIAQPNQSTANSLQLTDKNQKQSVDWRLKADDLQKEEREVLRTLEYFETVVKHATKTLSPNEIANYLLNLSKSFNSFYEKCPILGVPEQDLRLKISVRVGETIKLGLYLLGIDTVDKM